MAGGRGARQQECHFQVHHSADNRAQDQYSDNRFELRMSQSDASPVRKWFKCVQNSSAKLNGSIVKL